MSESITSLPAAVASEGALPMPVGDPTESGRLTPQREVADGAVASLVNGGYAPQIAKEIIAGVRAEAEEGVRAALLAELAAIRAKRDRYRLAWQSARERAQAYGEGILQVVKDRESYQGWLKQAEAELAKYVGHEPTIAEEITFLRRCVDDVHAVCDEAEEGSLRWENPLPVPEWVAVVREAADGVRPPGAEREADAVQYGIRIPDGSVLNGDVTDRADQEARLARYRDCWPEAVIVQRRVRHGAWTEATS
ncbi:hypothetical protein [Streptomyces venezuelae]